MKIFVKENYVNRFIMNSPIVAVHQFHTSIQFIFWFC